MGTFAVQIAKAFDAEVTGVCSTTKMDLVRSIGADQVIAGGSIGRIFQVMFLSLFKARSMKVVIARVIQRDLLLIAEMMAAGKVKSIIDKSFPLSETASALRYLGEGRARGKVVITVGG